MDKPTHIQNIISRTASLAGIDSMNVKDDMVRFVFDTRIIAGDYMTIGLQNSAPIEVLEQSARNILRNELTVMFDR